MSAQKERVELTLQKVWIRAMREEVRIRMPDERQALRMRFALYNSVRRIRANPGENPTLAQAVEHCVARIDHEDKCVVVVAENTFTQVMEQALADIGFDPNEVKTPEDIAADESLKRLMERDDVKPIGAPEVPSPAPAATPSLAEDFDPLPRPPMKNPYYTRD